jgi:hypothetical protein
MEGEMSSEKFNEVVTGLCTMYKLDPRHVLEGGPVTMGGSMFCLLHNKEMNSSLLMVYCDFGKVPAELETKVHRKLLEANLSTYTGQGETFCLDSDGRVVFVNNYPLDILTSEELAAHLALTSIYAKKWRENYFLDESDTPKKKWQGARFFKQGTTQNAGERK